LAHRKVSAIDIQIGSRLRAARLANRISQQKLGRAIGVKTQQVHKYETGANRMAPNRLHGIANFLGVVLTSTVHLLALPSLQTVLIRSDLKVITGSHIRGIQLLLPSAWEID
jgi:transcriptional regulator with XRE-family HTH domain